MRKVIKGIRNGRCLNDGYQTFKEKAFPLCAWVIRIIKRSLKNGEDSD